MPISDIKFTNNARTLLSTSSLANDATSVSVDDGSVFPSLSSGNYFYATLERASDSTIREIVKVTARSGNDLTIVRAQDNTSATTFSADDIIELRLTAKAIEDIRDAVSPTLTQEQVEDYVGGMLDGTETFIDVSYDDTDGNIDFVVPVKDEDNMASDSATHLATQQSIKAYVDDQVGTNSITTYKYTATAGQTTFSGNDDASNSLSYTVGNLLVILNGATLINGTDYTASNGTSVVLTDAATVDDELIIYAFAAFTASTQALTLFKYSATAGQTTFTGSDSASQTLAYTAGMIIVTLNGVVLDTSDYTASNGTSVVLDSAASASDELNIIAFTAFNSASVTTASADFSIGDDLSFTSDGAIINMGADSDVTITHVHDTGIKLNSTLHLEKSDSTTYDATASDGQVSVGPTIYLENPANANDTVGGQIVFGMRSTEAQARIGATGGTSPSLVFGTADAQRMEINSAGEVGIGTSAAADSTLKVYNNETGHNVIYVQQDNASSGSHVINLGNDGTGYGFYNVNNNGSGIYSQGGRGAAGYFRQTGSVSANYGVYGQADSNYGIYGRTTSGSHGGLIAYDDTAACYGIIGYSPSSTLYSLYGNGSTFISGSYTSSDSRLKDIQSRITTSDGILAKVNQLKPTYYKWKANSDQGKTDDTEQIGFIAQEVESIFSDLVKQAPVPDLSESPPDADGNVEKRDKTLNEELGDTKFITYEKLTVYLTAALQEASAKIDALEARIKTLEDASG